MNKFLRFRPTGPYAFPRRLLCVAAILFVLTTVPLRAFAQDDGADDRQDAIAIFNQAQDAHEKGDLSGAIALYKKALLVVPEFAEAEYQSGVAYLALKDRPSAETAFRRALAIRADWTLPMTSLGSMLLEKGSYAEAETLLARAIELDAQNFPAYSALAELLLRKRPDPASLTELLNKIVPLTEKAKPSAALWTARAALENELGKRKEASVSLTNALSLDPNNVFALSELARLALAADDGVKASEAVDKLEKLAPSDRTKLLRVRVLAVAGRTAEALKLLETVDPTTSGAAELKSALTINASEDVAQIEKLLEAEPANAAILGRLCKLYRISDPAKALDRCRRASEAEPDRVEHAIGYGAALVQAKQFVQAVGLFRKLTASVPDNSTVHANLASALFELKRYNEAKIEYQWLIERQPDLVVAYYLLAVTHDHLTEYMDAMANYQQFLRLADPVKNRDEIEKVKLRLPSLQKQISGKKGK